MTKPLLIYERFDVVVVPYPFSDRDVQKRRPAVLLSPHEFHDATGQAVMAMVTTARRSAWPQDVALKDIRAAGLPKPSYIRMRLATVDLRFVTHVTGKLSTVDRVALQRALMEFFDV